jgi:hypothetical protein
MIVASQNNSPITFNQKRYGNNFLQLIPGVMKRFIDHGLPKIKILNQDLVFSKSGV